jgi:DNA-binding NarL/FixJ family response regulator
MGRALTRTRSTRAKHHSHLNASRDVATTATIWQHSSATINRNRLASSTLDARRFYVPHSDLNDAISAKLQQLIATEPAERKSKLETTLDPHRELITKALAKGHTYRAIATTLRDAGLNASPETVRRYIRRISDAKTKRPARRSTASTLLSA